MMNMFKGLLGNLDQEGGEQPQKNLEGIPKDQNTQMD